MENITNYSNFELNESTIEIDDSNDGVYVLTLHDIHNIVNKFTDSEIDENTILEELEDYKFVKVEDAEITEVDNEDDISWVNDEVEEIDELSSDDENPFFIKKFEK